MLVPHWLLTTIVCTPMFLGLAGCVAQRETAFDIPSTPKTTVSGVTVSVPRITRSADRIGVDVQVHNATADFVDLARHNDLFPSIRLFRGDLVLMGYKQRAMSRNLVPERYTIRPGGDATLHIDFAAVGIDTATGLNLQVDGRTHGQIISWRPSMPTTGAETPAPL